MAYSGSQITELSVLGIPGRVHTFSAKTTILGGRFRKGEAYIPGVQSGQAVVYTSFSEGSAYNPGIKQGEVV